MLAAFAGFLFAGALMVCAPARGQDQPAVIAKVESDGVYLGQPVTLHVTLSQMMDPPTPPPPRVEGLTITLVGRSPINFRQVINGRLVSNKFGVRLTYQLVADRAGDYEIPGPSVEYEGKQYSADPIRIRVASPPSQDVARVQLTVEPESLYIRQPFRLRLRISVQAIDDPQFANADPLTLNPRARAKSPVIIAPWAVDHGLPDEIEPQVTWRRWLAALRSEEGGFGINNIRDGRSAIALFRQEQLSRFSPSPKRELQRDDNKRMREYWVYRFDRVMRANEVGDFTIPGVRLEGLLPTSSRGNGRVEFQEVYVYAAPLTINVREPPDKNRPAAYTGAVGKFDVSASLTPHEANVGEPMTLTVAVQGDGSIQRIQPPPLETIAAVNSRFRVYEPTVETGDASRTFTYKVRPLSADVSEFPSVPFAFFDVEKERYVTKATAAIPVEIAAVESLSGSQIAIADSGSAAGGAELENTAGGIFANVTDVGQLRDERVRPAPWLATLAVLAGAYAGFAAVVLQRRRRDRLDPQRQHRRAAANRSAACLEEARSARRDRPQQCVDSVRGAFAEVVAAPTGSLAASLTPNDVRESLEQFQLPAELVADVVEILESCDAYRYGAPVDSLDGLVRDAERTSQRLIDELRQRKLL
jgi:hypothetical protein